MNTYIFIKQNANQPAFSMNSFTITQETEKAIKVKSDETNKETWLPKRGLKQLNEDIFTLAPWFKKTENGQTASYRLFT